jgi:hypothetical protein
MAEKPAKKPNPALTDPRVIDPATYGVVEVAAIKALANGTADPDQQKHALQFILVCVCRVDDEPYFPGTDGERDTTYRLGMRRVGTFIRSLIFADIKKFKTDAAPTEQG